MKKPRQVSVELNKEQKKHKTIYYGPQSAGINVQSSQIESTPKGQLILKANFKVFIWTKKLTKYFSISALASKNP